MTEPVNRLYRLRDDARVAGVCGGLGEYLSVDPVVIRLVWVVTTCFTGIVPGLLAYALAWAVVPLEPELPIAHPAVDQPHDSPA